MADRHDILARRFTICYIRYFYRGVVPLNALSSIPHRILVLGLGKSGLAAARLLLQKGKVVRINDAQIPHKETILELESKGAELVVGSHPLSVLEGIELIVKSPGIPYQIPLIKRAE